MGSLTVVRNLLVHHTKSSNKSPANDPRRLAEQSYRMRFLRRHKKEMDLETQENLPAVPGATLTGLRTFIRRNNRDRGAETQATNLTTLVEDEDSYQLIGKEPQKSGLGTDTAVPLQRPWQQYPQHIYQVRPLLPVKFNLY